MLVYEYNKAAAVFIAKSSLNLLHVSELSKQPTNTGPRFHLLHNGDKGSKKVCVLPPPAPFPSFSPPPAAKVT